MNLAVSIMEVDSLLPFEMLLEMESHQSIRDEYDFVPREILSDRKVIAAGNANITLSLDCSRGVDVAGHWGIWIDGFQGPHIRCRYAF